VANLPVERDDLVPVMRFCEIRELPRPAPLDLGIEEFEGDATLGEGPSRQEPAAAPAERSSFAFDGGEDLARPGLSGDPRWSTTAPHRRAGRRASVLNSGSCSRP
jgi:hypothetical protein